MPESTPEALFNTVFNVLACYMRNNAICTYMCRCAVLMMIKYVQMLDV